MKNKAKLLALIAMVVTAITVTTQQVKAQTTPANAWRFGVGIEVADPTGTARIGSHFSLGGTARIQYGISDALALTFTSGAYHFFPTTNPATGSDYNSYGVIPIKAGIKAFFAPDLYVGAEGGVGIEATDDGYGPTRLLLSPALGYANEHWDFGVHYDHFSGATGAKYGLLGLRLAYGFKL
jgi:hypothetical protein